MIESARVAVVGGAGFLGSHLVNYLIDHRDCHVLVIDNLCAGKLEFIHPAAVFEHADISVSEKRLYDLFKQHKVEFVFNYAAHPYIPMSFERPNHVFMTNAVGAIHVINAAQEAGCRSILQVSSAELYGESLDDGKMDEDARVVPHSSYGAAKAAIDYYCQVRWREAETPVISLRQFNCVGERETHPYVIPEIIAQLSKQSGSTAVVLLGNNSARDFQYAGDAVRMACQLVEKSSAYGQVFNMGSTESIRIYDLARMIGRQMGFDTVRVQEDPKRVRPWEIWRLRSDNQKLYAEIGRPEDQVPLEEAIRRTIQYFHQNGDKWCWQ